MSTNPITPIAEEFISATQNIGAKKSKSCLRETGDWRRISHYRFYNPASPITPSAEESVSSTPNNGAKKSKLNRHQIL